MYFRKAKKKPVLLIDFDYQGSLSECVRGEAGYTDRDMTAHALIMPPAQFPNPEIYCREMRRKVEDVFLFPADYPFATIENNEMIAWVRRRPDDGGPAQGDDLIHRLCQHLRRPEIQNKFGAVIIDSPPRLTTGAINALSAATALIVPTTLDDMSAQAAQYFLQQIDRMQNAEPPLFPALRIVGIVPSIVSSAPGGKLQLQEARALARLKEYGATKWGRDDFVIEEAWVQRRAEIARAAGIGVAYVRSTTAEAIFDKLGQAIEKRLT
jgi:chromosome partitioning protein